MPTAFELAKLQEHAYAVAKALNSGLPLPEGGPDALNWTLLRDIPLDLLRDKASGYNRAVYFNAAGELAIVHVGTQEFRDLVADGGIALKILPKGQLDAANALVDFVRGQTELRDATIWQTGHSLGGLLAELSTASQLTRNFDENMYALTIASPGGSAFMKAIGADPDIDYASRMTNIYRAMDPVGTLGRHIGTEIQLGDGRTYWQTEGLFMPIPLLGEALFAKRVVTDHLLSNYESALSQQDVELRPVAAPLAPTAASGGVPNATSNWFRTRSAP